MENRKERSSPKRRSSRHSPKHRNRSRSPIGSYNKFRPSKENDIYSKRSRSNERNERKNRKYDDIKKPTYRGPENESLLGRVYRSPSKIMIVAKMDLSGEGKSHFNDEVSKQNASLEWNRTILEAGEDRKYDNKGGRFVYIRTHRKDENGTSNPTIYNGRGNFYEKSSSPNDRNVSPMRNNYDYPTRRDYEFENHGKDYESNRRYRHDDYDRFERSKKDDRKYRSHRSDKPYSDEERRSHSSHKRENSKDRRHYDKYDKYEDKNKRSRDSRRKNSDLHCQNRDEQFDDHHKNEKHLENQRESFENEQKEQCVSTNENVTHMNGGSVTPGTRPTHVRNDIPLPTMVPMPPMSLGYVRPIPPLRPFPIILRPPPFGIPMIRRFPFLPPRFFSRPIP